MCVRSLLGHFILVVIRNKMDSVSKVLSLAFSLLVFLNQSNFAVGVKFGCPDLNENFENEHDQISIFDAQYGEEMTPWKFENNNAFALVLQIIKNVHSEIMKFNVVNTVYEFLEFYRSRKTPENENLPFATFFDNYHPEFAAAVSSPFGIINKIINYIRVNSLAPGIEDYFYFATSDVNVDNATINKLDELTENPNWFAHNNIVGAVRFIINGRRGNIIIDCAELDIGPKVYTFMDDGRPLWVGDRIVLEEIITPVLPDLFSKKKNHIVYTYGNGKKNRVIFVGLPFCSLLESGIKSGLVSTSRMILKRDESMDTKAKLSFTLQYGTEFPIFNLYFKFPQPSFFHNKTVNVPFVNVNMLRRKSTLAEDEVLDLYDLVEKELEQDVMTRPLIKKLELAAQLAADDDFLKELEILEGDLKRLRNEFKNNS